MHGNVLQMLKTLLDQKNKGSVFIKRNDLEMGLTIKE
jgi:hypothetical protein